MTWLVVVLLLVLAAVPAPPTLDVAIGLATIATIASPFVLKYIPLAGAQMTAFTMLVALAVAVLASYLTGDLVLSREGITAALLNSSAVWAAQQAVYAVFKAAQPTWVGATPKAPAPVPPPPAPGASLAA